MDLYLGAVHSKMDFVVAQAWIAHFDFEKIGIVALVVAEAEVGLVEELIGPSNQKPDLKTIRGCRSWSKDSNPGRWHSLSLVCFDTPSSL